MHKTGQAYFFWFPCIIKYILLKCRNIQHLELVRKWCAHSGGAAGSQLILPLSIICWFKTTAAPFVTVSATSNTCKDPTPFCFCFIVHTAGRSLGVCSAFGQGAGVELRDLCSYETLQQQIVCLTYKIDHWLLSDVEPLSLLRCSPCLCSQT